MTAKPVQKIVNLRPNSLSMPEVLTQSIALIAPTLTAALNASFTFASAGNAAWLAYVFATIGLVLVGLNINQFARHSASAGALYTYVAQGLGSTAGIICGWVLVLAYLCVAGAEFGAFAHYINLVLAEFGLHLPLILLGSICIGTAWYYAYTDTQLSTLLMLILELVSVGFVVILAFLILAKQGFHPDVEQLTLKGATPSGFSLGMVIAIFSFVGFESAATLGDEAKSPLRSIPRALIWSTVLCGLFFILITYTEVLGFRIIGTPLNESAAPLSDLANLVRADLLGVGLTMGIAFSCFSGALASIIASSRIGFALSRHSFFPSPLGEVHKRNKTPHVAVTLSSIVILLLGTLLALFGVEAILIYGYLGTISTYGFLVAYLLLSIAAPVFLAQRGALRWHHLLISILAGFFMLIPVAGSFYPVPAFPFNVFPYLFLLYLALGGWLFSRFRRRSQVIENLERDFETRPNLNT